jgi:hypothetical protein
LQVVFTIVGPLYDNDVVAVADSVFVVVVTNDVVKFALIQLDSSMLFCLLKKRAVTSIGKLMMKLLVYLTKLKH